MASTRPPRRRADRPGRSRRPCPRCAPARACRPFAVAAGGRTRNPKGSRRHARNLVDRGHARHRTGEAHAANGWDAALSQDLAVVRGGGLRLDELADLVVDLDRLEDPRAPFVPGLEARLAPLGADDLAARGQEDLLAVPEVCLELHGLL